MRPAPGKVDGLILDHAANGHRFGVPDQPDVYSLTDEDKTKRASRGEPEAATCPQCHLLLPIPTPATCPSCKRLLRAERAMATERVELEIRELSPADEADRYAWYRGCIDTSRRLGKKLGWVFYRYQERWGEKPPTWMPCKAGIYEALFGRPAPRLLIEIARNKGNQVEAMA